MVRAKQLGILAASSIAALVFPASALAQAPYPPGVDHGISDYLARTPAACIKLPIDGGVRPHTPDDGPRNPPARQQAIDVAETMAELGLMERTPSSFENHREYRIKDAAAYDGRGAFCYGKEVLTNIVSLSPPQTRGPFCVREAEVLTAFRDVPDWMGLPSLAPYVENRATWKLAGRRTIQLNREGKRWVASTPYDPVHSNWFGPRAFDACAAQR